MIDEHTTDRDNNDHQLLISTNQSSVILLKKEHRKLIAKATALLYNIVRTNQEYQRDLLETKSGVEIIGSLLHLTMIDKKAAEDEAFDWM